MDNLPKIDIDCLPIIGQLPKHGLAVTEFEIDCQVKSDFAEKISMIFLFVAFNLMIIVHVSFTLLQHIYFEYFSHKILVIFNSNTDKFSFMTTVRAVDYRTAGGRGVV